MLHWRKFNINKLLETFHDTFPKHLMNIPNCPLLEIVSSASSNNNSTRACVFVALRICRPMEYYCQSSRFGNIKCCQEANLHTIYFREFPFNIVLKNVCYVFMQLHKTVVTSVWPDKKSIWIIPILRSQWVTNCYSLWKFANRTIFRWTSTFIFHRKESTNQEVKCVRTVFELNERANNFNF